MISSRVFITKGPCCTTGSPMGVPVTRATQRSEQGWKGTRGRRRGIDMGTSRTGDEDKFGRLLGFVLNHNAALPFLARQRDLLREGAVP